MGIHNLCKLLNPIASPSSQPAPFDSLLIDCQSFLYVAIEQSLETRETKLFHEICESTWDQLYRLLHFFIHHPARSENLVIVLSFDGEGVPMKWATQRQRRSSKRDSKRKSFYRYMLFGNNQLTIYVQDYLLEKLKAFHHTLTILLAGCNVPGEGEHKIFHIAESSFPGCKNPIVISIDQDVFILALLRLQHYESLQVYRYKTFYHVTRLATRLVPLKRFLDISFLFGNDFIPSLVSISLSNIAHIHEALAGATDEDPPATLATFLARMAHHIRFDTVEFIDQPLIVCFWMTYLWILDYYTQRHFPQQFLENRIVDAFDRNQLLTALADVSYSRNAYLEAKLTYHQLLTQPIPHAEHYVFIDSTLLNDLKKYWIEPQHTLCNVLKLTSSRAPRTGARDPAIGTA